MNTPPPAPEEVSALLSPEEWAGVLLYCACAQARQLLHDGAPGRALEVLEEALARYDQEQDQNLGTSQPPF